MAAKPIIVWFDPEGDFLEVTFEVKPGYSKEMENDQIMKRVDLDGNLIGFSITNVSQLGDKPGQVVLEQ
jgi:hypothetical protein